MNGGRIFDVEWQNEATPVVFLQEVGQYRVNVGGVTAGGDDGGGGMSMGQEMFDERKAQSTRGALDEKVGVGCGQGSSHGGSAVVGGGGWKENLHFF